MTTETPTVPKADECYRCGYLLHGIADDQACPECGLLAIRSRRVSDELYETRPKWLRNLFLGVSAILLSILISVGWTIVYGHIHYHARWRYTGYLFMQLLDGEEWPVGIACGWVVFFLGVLLLTGREGYEPADKADRRFRIFLRCAALMPLLPIGLMFLEAELWHHGTWFLLRSNRWEAYSALAMAFIFAATLGILPLPPLLFLRLRHLAKRARSAHLAEHCVIVGIGTSLSLLYVLGVYELFEHSYNYGLYHGSSRDWVVSLILVLGVGVAVGLFTIWSGYLMIRFAVAFLLASRQRSRNWRRDDRSLQDFKSQI